MRYLIPLFLLIVLSCNYNGRLKNVTIEESSLPPVIPLKLEKINVSEDYLIGQSRCYVYNDSILLVLKNGDPYPSTHLLTVVNMNTGRKICEYFTRGKGPNELLSSIGFLSNNYLDINCYITSKLVPFNIDSALIMKNKYKPLIITPPNNLFSDFTSIDDTTMLIANDLYFDGCNKYMTNGVIEFFKISKDGKCSPEWKKETYKNIKKYPGNVNGCEISVNKKKRRVVCCYHFQPYIKVFDLEMNPIKKINGPEPNDGVYKIDGEGELSFNFDKGINHYYEQSFCDNENIFVLNRRNHDFKSYKSGLASIEKETTEIFQLDWDGNVVGRYSAKGYEILYTSYSQNSNTLYLSLIDNDGERALFSAKLNSK